MGNSFYATPRAMTVALIVTATALSMTGCSKSNKSQASVTPTNVTLTAAQLQHVRLFTVTPSHFHKGVDATGSVDFDNDQATSVLAPFSGPVAKVLVQPGEHVRKGQPLAEVDSPDFATAVGNYRAAVIAAQTDRRLADMDKDLLAHQGVAQREEAQAQADAIAAEGNRDAARQTLVSLGIDPRTLNGRRGKGPDRIEGIIRSPFAGTVAEKLISPGQLLQAGSTACFTIADLSRVWVMAQIFGADLANVHAGDSAMIDTGLGLGKFAGHVDNVAALVDPDTHSVMARVVVDNPGDQLKKQMYVRVTIQSRQEQSGTLVPVSAVLRDDENLPFVYLVQRDGSFARRHITLGDRTGDQYDITEGLARGDRIVADGAIFIQFMQSQ